MASSEGSGRSQMFGWTTFSWDEVALAFCIGLAIAELNLYLVTAVLHRGMCHRAIVYPSYLTRMVAVWLWLTVCTSPLAWIASHLHHHANADTADDPHAPGIKGFWQVLLLTWYYVQHWARDNWTHAERRYLRFFRHERIFHAMERRASFTLNFYLQMIGSVLLGPVAIAFWIARFVPYLLASGYVNAVGHTHGARPFANQGTDSRGVWQKVCGYLVGGEPLGHNFHHRFPTSPTFRQTGFDPGLWFSMRILRGVPRKAAL
jgi:stearoyl-CoA desaturase (Delta-9 desaturase)